MSHDWHLPILAPERTCQETGEVTPAVHGFVTCRGCKMQLLDIGYKKHVKLLYRETAAHEWKPTQLELLACGGAK